MPKLIENQMILIVFCFLNIGVALAKKGDLNQIVLALPSLHQVLLDSDENVDGLDNARSVVLSQDEKMVFVVSADDNSLTIFDVDDFFQLKYKQIFSAEQHGLELEGAISVVHSRDTNNVYVLSFYNGALLRFIQNENGRYEFKQKITDGLTPLRVFKSRAPISAKEDSLKILGGYGLTISNDNRKLYVAASISNSLTVFDIDASGAISYAKSFISNDNPSLKGAVSVAISKDDSVLAVAGMEGNAIGIYNNIAGEYKEVQIFKESKHLVAPVYLVFSSDGHYLFIACPGSNAFIVLKKGENNLFEHFQTFTDSPQINLKGVGHITLSPSNDFLFVTSEQGHVVNIFSKMKNNKWKLASKIDDNLLSEGQMLSPTSSAITADAQFLLVTFGEGDSLQSFKLY